MDYSIDGNIEDRIKNIIHNKLQNNEFKSGLNEDHKEIIEKLFEIFPDLKDKTKYDTEKDNKPIVSDDNYDEKNEILLDEIKINDIIYYKDGHGGIWNENADLIGVVKKNNTNVAEYCFFDKQGDMVIDIMKIINS